MLGHLGALHQFTRAEIYFAETAREMLVTGDWVTPRFCENIFFDKPPLVYWLIAISLKLFGTSEAAARLPSAIAGVTTIILTALFARKQYGDRAGLLAGAVRLTTSGFWVFARSAMSDAWLTLCVSAALFAYHEALSSDDPRKVFVFLGHLCVALAVLSKGPVGILLTGLAVTGALRFTQRGRWKRHLPIFKLCAIL